MENNDKEYLINKLMELIGDVVDVGESDEIFCGLIDLCCKATDLPTISEEKKQWIKPWRLSRAERGSFCFLTKELLLSDESSYRNYLRMSKSQFQFLLSLVEQDISKCDTKMREALRPSEKLALTLRFIATGESFRSLDYQSRVSRSSISGIVPQVCEAIWKRLKTTYLKFPSNPTEWEVIAREFAIKWQFPNCLGALDGKHINFRPSRRDGAFFHNYKGANSIVLMALVDANCKFIFVDIGANGRNNDAGIFLQSRLSTILQEAKDLPHDIVLGNTRRLPYVVVGDDAFPMQKHLMKPYPFHTISQEKQVFNARISRARHVVEHAFGMLANRFRVFLSPMNLKAEKVEIITFACVTLHNFLLQTDETYTQSGNEMFPSENFSNLNSVYNPRKGEAESIRQQFMEYFNNEGKLNWL